MAEAAATALANNSINRRLTFVRWVRRTHGWFGLCDPRPATIDAMEAWLQQALTLDRPAGTKRVERARPVAWAEKGGEQRPLNQPERWTLNFAAPNHVVQVEYWAGNKSVGVRTTENGFIATLTNLHKGTGMPVPWILLIDTLAGSLIFLSISGAILWWETHRRRGLGIAIFGLSVVVTVALPFRRCNSEARVVSESQIPLMVSLGGVPGNGSGEPMSVAMRRGVLALVIFFHVGGGWALTQVEPAKMIVGDIPALEVRTVSADTPAAPEEQKEEPPPEPPLAEEPPPPEIPIPDLASVLDPPPPDLPPPAFPIEAKPPPPQPPKPPPPKPVQKAVPVPVAPVAQAPAVAPTPKLVQAAQLGFLISPNPVYPGSARRAGNQATTMVRMLVDIAGRPTNVSIEKSSGFPALDESAVSAVRASQLRPYSEGGTAQAVWVIVPIRFVLQ